jgi:hypothetical protein
MADLKENGVITSQASQTSQSDLESTSHDLPTEKKGTVNDQRDMFRMGKAQELRVRAVPSRLEAPGHSIHRSQLVAKLPLCLHLWLLHDPNGLVRDHFGH